VRIKSEAILPNCFLKCFVIVAGWGERRLIGAGGNFSEAGEGRLPVGVRKARRGARGLPSKSTLCFVLLVFDPLLLLSIATLKMRLQPAPLGTKSKRISLSADIAMITG